jgi:hypothetical protein
MFVKRLNERGHDPELAHVMVTKAEVALWLAEVTRDRFTTASATNHIKMLGLRQLSERHTRMGGVWVWRGERATSDNPEPIKPPRFNDDPSLTTRAERERRRSIRTGQPEE